MRKRNGRRNPEEEWEEAKKELSKIMDALRFQLEYVPLIFWLNITSVIIFFGIPIVVLYQLIKTLLS
jgi:hypothetical protein